MKRDKRYFENVVTNCTRCKTEIPASESLHNTGYCDDCAVLVSEIQKDIKEKGAKHNGKTTTDRSK